MERAMATEPADERGERSANPNSILLRRKSADLDDAQSDSDRCAADFSQGAQLQCELDEMADALDEIAKLIIY